MLCALCCLARGAEGEVDLAFGFVSGCCCFLDRFRGRDSTSNSESGSGDEVDDGDDEEAAGMAMAQSSRISVGVRSRMRCSRLGCAMPVGEYSQD
jgi:hypothetical protein